MRCPLLASLWQAAPAEAGDEMIVRRIGLIDLEGVLRASKGTAKVRDLLDEQRKHTGKNLPNAKPTCRANASC